jgi:methylated-DNA-[protein]-cysteine S-methyltransferase
MADSRKFDAVTATPLGPIGVRVDDEAVSELVFLPDGDPARTAEDPLSAEAVRQIRAYFADPGFEFSLPLALRGTAFQRRVWSALLDIPVGEVRAYGELAAQLGTAARAVGGACRANPCPILVPCHRVVGARGMGGFAGAATGAWLDIKERLLRHEGVRFPP